MSNILFLDIDGPICTERAYKAYEQDKHKQVLRAWDPIAIRLIDRLCLEYDMEVVVSSTWREVTDVPLHLLTHGFRGSFHQNCKTPSLRTHPKYRDYTRADEINQWIRTHLKRHTIDRPAEHKVLIIDDEESGSSLMEDAKLKQFSIMVDINNGFSLENYNKAKNIIKNTNFILDKNVPN